MPPAIDSSASANDPSDGFVRRISGEGPPRFSGGDPRYRKFVELFNREQFFEAHEVLEDLWREISGPDRNFYQGLIQVAAAFVHVQRKNPEGAEDLYAKALKHLAAYPARHQGIDAGQLIKSARKTLDLQKNFPKIQLDLPIQRAKG